MNVSLGNLPEGFCPSTMQELASAIVSRLIITPNQSFTSFAIGSTAPTTNVGPWLKDCLEWFVFDDSTGTYVPTTKEGFNNIAYYTASNTFVVPDFIYKLKVHAWGGGAGGNPEAGTNGAGGGGGGYGLKVFNVMPAQVISFTVGAGGAAAAPGGPTMFLTMTAGGGTPGTTTGATSFGGNGGTTTGADMPITGQGGGSPTSASFASGSGGDSPTGGPGGVYSPTAANANGQVPGGGGAGGTTATGAPVCIVGLGAGGAVLVEF